MLALSVFVHENFLKRNFLFSVSNAFETIMQRAVIEYSMAYANIIRTYRACWVTVNCLEVH